MAHNDKGEAMQDLSDGYIEVDGVRLKLSQPYTGSAQWIGQREILMQLLACWITVDEADLPLTPRLLVLLVWERRSSLSRPRKSRSCPFTSTSAPLTRDRKIF